jgi:hypothetical protein
MFATQLSSSLYFFKVLKFFRVPLSWKRSGGLVLRPWTVVVCAALLANINVHAQGSPVPLTSQPLAPTAANPAAKEARLADAYGKLPLSFEVNHDQTNRRVKFLSRGSGYALFLTGNEAVLALRSGDRGRKQSPRVPPTVGKLVSSETTNFLRMRLLGTNPAVRVAGVDELPGKANYFVGNHPKKWQMNVPTYAKVKYADIYPGIDLVYYGNQRQLEYDFIVAPGADPNEIRLKFDGAGKLRVDEKGDLLLGTEGEEVRFEKPVIYQEVGEEKIPVEGRYVVALANRIGFQLGEYDHDQPLVIDPALSYSTYLGGSDSDWGLGIAVDASGNAYVTGATYSTNFPTVNALQSTPGGPSNPFVTKINASGSAVVYSTYLGGSDFDGGLGIAVDASGNAYVTGQTSSHNFPTVNALQPTLAGVGSDVFVTKINASGSALVYSTYLGGNSDDIGLGIAVDASGNAYVTGFTYSTNFPAVNALQSTGGPVNAFVTKINASGSALVYSTYLGNYFVIGSGIAVDPSGNAYVTGYTATDSFPTVNALQSTFGGGVDAFVTKINASGSALVYSTYLGGSMYDAGRGIAVNASGNAYVTGETCSTNLPTANALQPALSGFCDAFVAKINASGSALVYSTYLGGSDYDVGYGIAVDASGNAYVTGQTVSTNFPTVNALQSTICGSSDAFVTKINASGSALVYSTYLGGSGDDIGSGIAVDASGNAYVTGYTVSHNFPTVNAVQSIFGGSVDAFVTKINGVVIVSIDVEPGEDPPTVNAKSQGKIPVAILSSITFNAPTQVKVSSLTFGHTGNEASLALCSGTEDVNGDGLPDLVCHFNVPLTEFQATDTIAILRGETNGGAAFMGTDTIRVIY